MKQGDMTILAQNVALEALDKLRKTILNIAFQRAEHIVNLQCL